MTRTLNDEPSPPAAPQRVTTPSPRSFLGHAKIIGLLTLASRLFGLLREIVAGHYLGTGLIASAFTVAFTIPNLFRKLFGEGALSAAFIPLYAQTLKHESKQAANEFAAAGVNLLCLVLLVITIAGELAIGAMILWGHRLFPDLDLTLRFTAIMLPYVLLICGGAFLSGILQVHKRFAAPAAAPILLNVVHVLVLFTGATLLGLNAKTPADRVPAIQTSLGYALAFFVLVAGVLQVMILIPGLRRSGFRFRPGVGIRLPKVRKMVQLTIPVALGAGVLQLSVLLDKGIAMGLMQRTDHAGQLVDHFSIAGHSIRFPMEMGAPRRLDIAQFMYQFPLGVFAIALATAIFPDLSAEALEKDRERFRSVLRQGVEATLWEGLPASIGLILVAEPAVKLLFRHGQISSHDTALIVRSVQAYAGAIWAFSLLQIVNRGFYALHDTKTPLVMSGINLLINLAVELPLIWTPLAEAGMAVGTLVSFVIQAVVMLWMLDRRIGGIGLGGSVTPILKMLAGTALMTGACLAVRFSPIYPRTESRLIWATQLSLLLGVGAAVYLLFCLMAKVEVMWQMVPARFRRRATGR